MPDHPLRRETDNGKIAFIRSLAKDWGWLIVMVAVALGFSIRTPGSEIQDVKTDIKEVKTEQAVLKEELRSLTEVTREQARDISTIVRLQCFNENYTARQLNLAGVKCDGIR